MLAFDGEANQQCIGCRYRLTLFARGRRVAHAGRRKFRDALRSRGVVQSQECGRAKEKDKEGESLHSSASKQIVLLNGSAKRQRTGEACLTTGRGIAPCEGNQGAAKRHASIGPWSYRWNAAPIWMQLVASPWASATRSIPIHTPYSRETRNQIWSCPADGAAFRRNRSLSRRGLRMMRPFAGPNKKWRPGLHQAA